MSPFGAGDPDGLRPWVASAASYYHLDAIGSVVGLTDSTGVLTDTYSYEVFGNVGARTGTNAQPYQYLENAYDPAVGRFTT